MTYYLAAPFNMRDEAIKVRDALTAAGHACTSEWIDNHKDPYEKCSDAKLASEAEIDINNIDAGEAFVLVNCGPSTSGGLHFECGVAWAAGKELWLIGPRTNLFHYLEDFQQASVEEIINAYAHPIE